MRVLFVSSVHNMETEDGPLTMTLVLSQIIVRSEIDITIYFLYYKTFVNGGQICKYVYTNYKLSNFRKIARK